MIPLLFPVNVFIFFLQTMSKRPQTQFYLMRLFHKMSSTKSNNFFFLTRKEEEKEERTNCALAFRLAKGICTEIELHNEDGQTFATIATNSERFNFQVATYGELGGALQKRQLSLVIKPWKSKLVPDNP